MPSDWRSTPGCNCFDCRTARAREANEPLPERDPEPEEERCGECDYPLGECVCESSNNGDEDAETKPGSPYPQRGERLVGVELEYNDDRDYNADPLREFARTWRAGDHYDGSCGREIVTAPLAGTYVDDCLVALGRALKESGVKADERCGVHVHVDAGDFAWADMFRLLHVYAKVEPILYMLAGQHRVTNTFCSPTGEKFRKALADVDRKGGVLDVAYNRGGANGARAYVREYSPNKKDGGRYKGLNICPWLAGRRANRRGKPKVVKKDTTVEFRLHRNTLDTDRVRGWARLCERIVSWCAKASDKEARALPKSALRALMVIAPESKDWILQRLHAWRKATARTGRAKVQRRISNSGGMWRISCAA